MTSRRRFLAALGAAAAGGALAGCGYYPGGGDIRWREGSLGGLYRSDEVGVTGETLYTAYESTRSFDVDSETWFSGGQVVAYDAGNGRERFSEQFDRPASAVALGAGDAVTALGDEEAPSHAVVRFGPDGQSWETTVDGGVERLAVADGRVYAVTADGALAACADGEVRWRLTEPPYNLPTPARTFEPARSKLVGAGPSGVVAVVRGALVHVAPDGSERWRRHDAEQVERVVAVGSDRVHVAGGDTLYALDAESGETRWSSAVTDADEPSYADHRARYHRTSGGIYGVLDGRLHALDDAGETRWTNNYATDGTDVAATDEDVFVHSGSGLVALDAADGSHRWTVEYDRIDEGPFLVDEGVLVVSGQSATCHVP